MDFYQKVLSNAHWFPSYLWQRISRRTDEGRPVHLIFCLANHFEPAIVSDNGRARAPRHVQERRLERWCQQLPTVLHRWRDADGRPFYHTYFFPAEQADTGLIEPLVDHCKAGWGEIEIHLHHGENGPDTCENTIRQLLAFRDMLASYGCLSQWEGAGQPRYAFVHGNFALANSAGGRHCGVDAEMAILAETGCYADLTLPAVPARGQVAKINCLYECSMPLGQRAPHRRGSDLRLGRAPQIFPIMVQGPLGLDFSRRKRILPIPYIENSELTVVRPPTMARLQLWRRAAVTVRGRPDWVFIKLHCHGMDPLHTETVLGSPMSNFLEELFRGSDCGKRYKMHFTTAREMVNIILAACDGRDGNPGDHRDYKLRPMAFPSGTTRGQHEAAHLSSE